MTAYMGAKETFDATKMQIQTVDVPRLADDQVLIKVVASSVNPIDWKICSGHLAAFMPVSFPMVGGFDCAGVVAAVGSACTRVRVGDEVWADVITRGADGIVRLGAYSEYVATSEARVGLKPKSLSFDQAGVLPLAALTAHQALETGKVEQGHTVLILGGSGGVGACAIQIAKAMGVSTVYATCSTRNEQFVAGLGATVINYTKEEWGDVLKGKGVDFIFDTVGGDANQDLAKAGAALKAGGAFASIVGPGSGELPEGMHKHFVVTKSDDYQELDKLKVLCEAGQLGLPIEETFALEKVTDAFELSMAGRVVGKVCVRVAASTAPER
jgi:NADPH:quinone reductase-like Zn-dependent oxidoreductase